MHVLWAEPKQNLFLCIEGSCLNSNKANKIVNFYHCIPVHANFFGVPVTQLLSFSFKATFYDHDKLQINVN